MVTRPSDSGAAFGVADGFEIERTRCARAWAVSADDLLGGRTGLGQRLNAAGASHADVRPTRGGIV